jgi:hypothetical protein
MRATKWWTAASLLAMTTCLTPTAEACGDGDDRAERRVLQRALRLVRLDPGVTARLIDPDLAANPDAVRRLDAFVVREQGGEFRRVIYVNCRSQIVQQAAAGTDAYVIVLAAVLHHEAQHVNGATEADARRAEAEFFRSRVRHGDVSPAIGEAYLEMLARRDDHASQ